MLCERTIYQLVEAFLMNEYPRYYIVDLAIKPSKCIVVELGCKEGVSIDDCVRINKYITTSLAPDIEEYDLEVGSAGISSPFKVLRQYEDVLGAEVEVLQKGGIKEKGILHAVTSEGLVLLVRRKIKLDGAKRKTEVEQELGIAMTEVLQAKRVLNF